MRPLFFIVSVRIKAGEQLASIENRPRACTFLVHSTRCKTDAAFCMQDTNIPAASAGIVFAAEFAVEAAMAMPPGSRFPPPIEEWSDHGFRHRDL
ncbi:MAG TPA: hypothetical protein VHB49_25635 [Bradyrhizobium sp.]|nr:hypothetical protein [Bradyrhizobium sp.]